MPPMVTTQPGASTSIVYVRRTQLAAIHAQQHANPRPFFLVRPAAGQTETAPVEDYATFFADVPPAERIVAFVDPSALPTNPGWPLRNLPVTTKRVWWEQNIQGQHV